MTCINLSSKFTMCYPIFLQLCFAYRGDPLDEIRIAHTDDLSTFGTWSSVSVTMSYRTSFQFMCVDLSQYVSSLRTYITRVRVWNYRQEAGYDLDVLENNMFVDTVMMLPVEDNLSSSYLNVINSYTSSGQCEPDVTNQLVWIHVY